MRKRIVIALVVLFGVVIGVIVLPGLFSKEPKYRGKTAEGWFKQYCRTATLIRQLQHQETVDALKALSSNSVPMLVEKYYSTNVNFALETNLTAIIEKLPASWNLEPITPASLIPDMAGYALREIKPAGELLLPLVTNRLHSPNENERLRTIELLTSMRMSADTVVPFLCDLLRSTNRVHRKFAIGNLRVYRLSAQSAIPALVELLNSDETDRSLIRDASRFLVGFSNRSAVAIPALKKRLASELNPARQLEYAITIGQIDVEQSDAMQFIVAIATNKTSALRTSAIHALGIFGSNADAARVLMDAARDEDYVIWRWAADTLLKLGQTNAVESALTEKLQDTNLSRRSTAALFLLNVNPTNSSAISLLITLLRDETTCSYVISRIHEFSPLPPPVSGALFEIVTNTNHRFHAEAQEAIVRAKDEMEARKAMSARYGLEN
jgi:HEAT repeat protein